MLVLYIATGGFLLGAALIIVTNFISHKTKK